jgi:VCBS repeat-containing protein
MNCISLLFIVIFGFSVNAHADIPQISQISPQETREDIAISIPLKITADSEIVSVSLESTNQTLVPNDYLLYDCDANYYTIVATPNFNQTGSATISIAVTDLENNTNSTNFVLTVTDTDDSMYYWNDHQTAALGIETVFKYPAAVAIDPITGKIFVSDTGNNRVLRFSKNETTISEAVFGDAGSYTMGEPMGLHIDPLGRLWVADMNNHRVLRFDHASSKPTRAPPDGILGKAEFLEYSITSQDAMKSPTDVWVDPTGTLWVADSENHRILRFNDAAQKENFANADAVLGQPNFTSMESDLGQSKMNTPRSIVVHQGHLFVADFTNNRVLCYKNAASKTFLAPADFVLGQPDFVTKEKHLSATGMDLPSGIAIDSQGRLFVAEQNNNRVLIFDDVVHMSNGDAASNVLGQADFISNSMNFSYNSLLGPYILNYDAKNMHLWVPDLIHNRVLRFDLNLKQPPSIGFINDQTIDENTTSQPFTFTVTDNNAQSLTITYHYSNQNLLSSEGIAFSGPQVTSDNNNVTVLATSVETTVNLVLTPEFEQFGTTTFYITVTDPHGMQDITSFTLNVSEVNDPPTITPIDDQTVLEDAESDAIHFTVADIEGNRMTIQVFDDSTDLFPSDANNITLSNENGGSTWELITDKDSDFLTLLLRPDSNQSGISTLTVTVSDGENVTHTNFTMTVLPQNDRPAISNIANQTIDEDTQSQAIPFIVSDPDASRLSITVLSDNQTLFPSELQHLTLTDAKGNKSLTFISDSGFVPLTLYVLPTANLSGASVITIITTDGSLSNSLTFTMNVVSVNDPPIISVIEDQTTLEETPVTGIQFTVNDIDSNELSVEVISNAPDIIPSDANHITLSNSLGETGYTLLVNPLETITLTLKPGPDATGNAEIIIKVTGGSTDATRSFITTVTPINDAPIFSKIEDQYAWEDTLSIIPFVITDPDADPITLTIATGNDLLIPSNARHLTFHTAHGQFTNTLLTIPGGEAISLNVLPLLNQSGKTSITITATDGIALASTAFMMSITDVNDAPTISSIEHQLLFEDTESDPIAFTVTDAEFDALTISVTAINSVLIPSDTHYITLSNASGHHGYTLATHSGDHLFLTLKSSLNLFGNTMISIAVTDGTLISSQSFTITVAPVNDAPIVSPIADISILEDTASPNIWFSVADPESDFLTIEIQSNNENLIATHTQNITLQNISGGTSYSLSTDPGPLTLTLHPNQNQIGSAQINVIATDGVDHSVLAFTMTVIEVNDVPVISFIPNQTTVEDTQSAPISFRINDVDANQLTISIQSDHENLLPLNADHITLCNASGGTTYTLMTHEKSNDLTLTVLPASNQTGDVSITVQAADVYSIVKQTFNLTITPVNDVPIIVPVSDHSSKEDMPDIHIPFTAYDFEDSACSLGITLISSNQTLLANHNLAYSCHANMYTIVANPSLNQHGYLNITIMVTDSDGEAATDIFGLELIPVNDAPVINAPEHVRVKMNNLTSISGIHIEDCDASNEMLSVTIVTDEGSLMMPTGQGISLAFTGTLENINTALSTLAYSPTFNALGNRVITLWIDDMGHSGDGGNQVTSNRIALQIHDDNVPPINDLPSLTMNEDESIQITPISVFDLDAANNAIEVTLSTKHGYLTLSETKSITLISGSFLYSTQMVISGSQYDINRALEHLTLTCTTHFNGWAALTMTTNDLGHTGEGYSPQTAINSVPITVLATIDAPTHVLPEAITLYEDIETAFTACVLDPDGEDIISVDLEVSTGTLQLNSGKGLTGYLGNGSFLSFTGKKSDVNYAMKGMRYKPSNNVYGNYIFTMTYHDMDFSAQSVSIPLRITAINDPPKIFVNTSAITINEDTPLSLSIAVSDIEADTHDIRVLLHGSHSQLAIQQNPGLDVYPSNIAQSLTLTGAIDSINSALVALQYTPTKNYYGNDSILIKVDDQGYVPLPAESAQKTISITIMPVNDPPDFILAPDTIKLFEDFSPPQIITITTMPPAFGEPSQITYTLSPEPETITWAAITFMPESGLITITSIENKYGAATFTVYTDDGADENHIASNAFSLTIISVNDPPDFLLSKDQILLNEDFTSIESISLTPGVIPEDEPKTITYALQPASLTWVNLTIDSETGHISITSIPHGHGTKCIYVIADDGADIFTQAFTMTVNSINDIPQITSMHSFSISENTTVGKKVHFVTAIDADHKYLEYRIDSIVPAADFAISKNSGDIWIASPLDYETIQNYTITVIVSDSITSVNQTIVATITDVNDAPVLLNIPEQTLTTFKNEPFEILDMNVIDVDARSFPIQLTLIATNGIVSMTHTSLTLESGNYSTSSLSVSGMITAINQAFSEIKFSPIAEYKGPANLLIEINDLGHTGPGIAQSDSASVSIFVLNYNVPPVFSVYPAQNVCFEDQSLTQTIVIYDEDAINEAIQLTLISDHGSLTMSNVTQLTRVVYSKYKQSYMGSIQELNAALNTLIFLPEKEFSGTAGYTLYANDLGHSGIGGPKSAEPEVITINCIAVNDAPVHTFPDQVTGLEESDIPLTLTVSDIDAYTHAIHVQMDAHQGVLSLLHMGGLILSNDGIAETSLSFTGTISAINDAMHPLIFHPKNNFYGVTSITITSNDLGFSVPDGTAEAMTETDLITITVINVNDPPEFSVSPLQSCNEDSVYSYLVQAEDIDGDPVALTVSALPDWLTFTDYGNNTGIVQGMPENEHVGVSAPITIVATDPNQAQSYQSFSIVVNNTNDAPSFHSTPIVQATEDSLYHYTVVTGDMDMNASLKIHANELPNWLQLKDHGDGTALLSGSPDNDDVSGINVVILSVSDGISSPIKQAFMIDVINTNDPPEIILLPANTAIEDMQYNSTITAYDMDGDPVSFIATALPDWMTLTNIGNNKAMVQGIPENQHVGCFEPVIITAQDPFNATATQAFAITVTNTNDTPAFSSIPITQATEDQFYVYTMSVIDVDIDASISFQAAILTEWLTFIDNGNGTATLSGIPRNEHVGFKNAAVIHATDGIAEEIAHSFMITVANTNDPPEIVSTAVLTATEDSLYSYTIIAEDMDGDVLEFTSDAMPQWLTLINNPNNTATLQGIPKNEHVGLSRPLTIITKDPDNVTATQTFSITVQNTNDQPVFVSQPITTAVEDSQYDYTITVQDVDMGASITINPAMMPHWLSFNDNGNGSAKISGIPLNDDVHKDNIVVITANDGIATAISQAFLITVINTNDAPMIISEPVLTATEDAPYVYTIIADDIDGDLLAFSSELPSWLTLIDKKNNTAILEGIPKNEDVGLSKTLTITAMDPSSATANQHFEILVINTNDPPEFSSIPNETAIEDMIYSYTVTVNDVDKTASIQINALNVPDWLIFVDNGNGTATITGTPLNDHVGVSNPIVITATDGIASEITQFFSIEVFNTNDIPEITSSAVLTATEDAFYSYTVIAKDVDKDILQFQAQMPSWLALVSHDNNTATLKGIPTNDDVGLSSPIILTAFDPDNTTATQTFVISVLNTNDAPTFETEPTLSAIEDSEYSYTIEVLDIDKNATISMNAALMPNWLTFNENGQGVAILTGTPKNEHVGHHPIAIIATDHIANEITQVFTITVTNTNDPPEITTISLPSVNEDSYYNALLIGEDMDGDLIKFSASGLPDWLTLINENNNTGRLQGTPKNEDIGQTETFIITVTDPDGATATRSFSFMVNNTNDPPEFISTPVTQATEDLVYTHFMQVDDIDPDPSIQFAALQLSNWLNFTDNGDGTAIITGTPLNEDVGDHSVVIIATDGIALPITHTFTIHVINTNDPPEITSTAIQTVDEDALYQYLITVKDVDGDSIRFVESGLPTWLKLSDNGDRTAILEGVPTNNDVGTTEMITISAIDPDHTIATQSFQITINNTNDAPWFLSEPNTFGIEDIRYSHTIRVEDIDMNDTLKIFSTTLPSWLTLTDNADGTAILTGTPLNAHVGGNAVVITAIDALALSVSQAFTIWVTNTNDAPVITSTPKRFVYEDALYTYELRAEDVDQNDHLHFEATALPQWLELTDNNDHTAILQGRPENHHVGKTALLTVSVIDETGETDSQSFTILVMNTNDYPEISKINSQTSVEYETTLPIPFTVRDIDGDPLSIHASSSDTAIVAIDSSHITFCAQNCNGECIQLSATDATHQINLTILPVRDGVADITITVADAELSASSSFTLSVTNVNIPPNIFPIADTIINEDADIFPIDVTVVDTDCDGRNLTITVFTDAPALLPTDAQHISINDMGLITHLQAPTPVDFDLYVSPLQNQSGSVGITITVTDADGASAIGHFKLTVNKLNDDPPQLSAIENITIVEDTTKYQTFFQVMDPDGGNLRFDVQSSHDQIVPPDDINCFPSNLSASSHIPEGVTLTFYPIADANGSEKITIIVRDDENHISEQSFLLTVTPVNDTPVMSDITSITINEDTVDYPISFTIVDADGDPLSLNALSDNTQLISHSDIHFQNSIETDAGIYQMIHVSISTQENAYGFAQLTLVVRDPSGSTEHTTFDITVTPINDPPYISKIAPQYIKEGYLSDPIDISISDIESGQLEIDAQTSNIIAMPLSSLTFSGRSSGNYVVDVTSEEPKNLTLVMFPQTDINGTVYVSLRVKDHYGLSASTQFPVTILPVNDMPSFKLHDFSIDVNEDDGPQSINNWITDISTGAYNEKDVLSFIIKTNHEQLFESVPKISISGTGGTLTFQPALNAYGTALVEIALTDGYSTTTEQSFLIHIHSINDAPNLTTHITARKIYENQVFAPIPFYLSDVDDDTISISIITDHQFFSDISICTETDCYPCSETNCEFQYVQTSKQTSLKTMLETLKLLTHITDEWNTQLQDIDNNNKINLSETLYYLNQVSTSFFLKIRPQTWQSGYQLLTLMVHDAAGNERSQSISLSVTPVSNPPILTFENCEGFEDDLIPIPLSVELADKDSEELLDIFISGIPEGASLNKGRKVSSRWVLTSQDLNYLVFAPVAHCSDDLTLTVTASSKEKTLSQSASVIKTMRVNVMPVADIPILELESSDISGQVDQDIPIVFKHLKLTDTDGSEQWDRIEIVKFPSNLQFSMGTLINAKQVIDLSQQTEMDLSDFKIFVTSSNEETYAFVIRVFSKEKENNDMAMREVQVKLSVSKGKATPSSDESGGCFLSIINKHLQ